MKRNFLAATAMVLAMTAPAKADVTLGGLNWSFNGVDNLTLQNVVPGGNQPLNIQCVICGAHQPQQNATFGYTDFNNQGSLTGIRMFSTNVPGGANPGDDTVGIGYGQGFLASFLLANGNPTLQFSIGIDINDSNTAQTLNSFFMLNLTTHTVLAAYTKDTLLPDINNGTGFPDYTLTGFNITLGTDIHAGDNIAFFARMSGLNDGPDSFFLEPVAVPGPIVGAGLPGLLAAFSGMGLFGLNRWRRKRNGGDLPVATA